jgi:excisionase family DNA binding protein
MEKQILVSFSTKELEELIRKSVREEISINTKSHEANKKKFLSAQEAAKFLNLAMPTLYAKTSKHEIIFHKVSRKLYFLEQDLERYLLDGRSKSSGAPDITRNMISS